MPLRKLILITVPSIVIGVLVMYYNYVPVLIWGQNIICFIVMSFIAWLAVRDRFNNAPNRYNLLILSAMLNLLFLTFMSPGMEGVHRWLSLGSLKVNVAVIVLPIIIINICKLLDTKGLSFGSAAAMATALLLFFQPDASQLTGFAIPIAILISSKASVLSGW